MTDSELGSSDPEAVRASSNGSADGLSRSKRSLWFGVAGAAALIVAAGLFAYNVAQGENLASLEAVPSNYDMVITVDIGQLIEDNRMDRLVAAFAEPMEEAGMIESAEVTFVDQIDKVMIEEGGLSFKEDVLPWLGRSITIAAKLPPEPNGDPNVIISLDITDADAAEQFIMDQAAGSLTASDFADGRVLESDGDDGRLYLADDRIVLTMVRSDLDAALAAIEGDSIATSDSYEEVVGELSADRVTTIYIGPAVSEMASLAEGAAGVDPDALAALGDFAGLGMAVSLVDEGVLVGASAILGEDALNEAFPNAPESIADRLPEETVGYIASVVPDGLIEEQIQTLREADPEAFEEMSRDARQQTGIDVFGELLPSIGGDMVFALIRSTDGLISDEFGVPVGAIVSLGLLDTGPMTRATEFLTGMLAIQGLDVSDGNPRVISAEGVGFGAYEITDDALVIGTSEAAIAGYVAGEGGLADAETYKRIDDVVEGDGLRMFFDLARILDLTPLTTDQRNVLAPLQGVGSGYSVDGGMYRFSSLLLIDY